MAFCFIPYVYNNDKEKKCTGLNESLATLIIMIKQVVNMKYLKMHPTTKSLLKRSRLSHCKR